MPEMLLAALVAYACPTEIGHCKSLKHALSKDRPSSVSLRRGGLLDGHSTRQEQCTLGHQPSRGRTMVDARAPPGAEGGERWHRPAVHNRKGHWPAMSIETKHVRGRRSLHFASFGAMLADAEQLVASPGIRMLGNWPLERLLAHLTRAIHSSIDGISDRAPWFVRLIGPLLKRRILDRGMSPGFRLPTPTEARFFPAAASPREALAALRLAAARIEREQMTAIHPVLGRLTHDEWLRLHLRHAELHLSFALLD